MMRRLHAARVATYATALFLALAAAAQEDQALYDPEPPEHFAFVRIIDRDGGGAGSIGFASGHFELSVDGVSDYVGVPAGEHELTYAGQSWPVEIASGDYITVVVSGQSAEPPSTLVDPPLDDPAKCGLYLYNFTDEPVSLAAPDLNAAVLENVQPGGSAFRAVNAVTVDLEVRAGNTAPARFEETPLQRRTAISFFVFGDAQDARAVMVTNRVAQR
jgi:hypothetical protein